MVSHRVCDFALYPSGHVQARSLEGLWRRSRQQAPARMYEVPLLVGCTRSWLPGISICKLYNLSPNDLFYKWEASTSNFNTMFRTQTAAKFDMEAVVSLKATLQRDLNDKKRQTPKMNRTAMVARNRMPVFGRNPMARAPATPQMKKEIVDVDMGDSTSTSTATYTPSAVVFRVEESKRNQSCEFLTRHLDLSYLIFAQIDTCMKRCWRGVKVRGSFVVHSVQLTIY